MSLDDVDVQQKKDPTKVVHWNEYEALRDSLRLRINNVTEPIEE